jgi:anti-anti-sigma factor
MSDEFTITTETTPRTLILRLTGLLDGRSAPKIHERCTANVGSRRLVINLSGVTMITSSGIGALLALVEEHGQEFGAVRIAAPSEAVRSVIRVLNLDQFLCVDDTEEQSVRTAEAA